MRSLVKFAAALAVTTAMLGSAHAAVYVFNFKGKDNSKTLGPLGNVRTATASNGSTSLGLRATGWNFAGGTVHSGYLGNYADGLGVMDSASDEHFIDNFGPTDFVLFQFSKPVTLTSAIFNAFGSPNFHQSLKDSDATIRAGKQGLSWTSNPFGNGTSQSSVLSLFPSSFTSYVTSNSGTPRTLNSGSLRSNSWVIQAGGADKLWDGFKIGQITVSAVPEPATWALMIVRFGAIGMAMRSRRTKVAKVSYAY